MKALPSTTSLVAGTKSGFSWNGSLSTSIADIFYGIFNRRMPFLNNLNEKTECALNESTKILTEYGNNFWQFPQFIRICFVYKVN